MSDIVHTFVSLCLFICNSSWNDTQHIELLSDLHWITDIFMKFSGEAQDVRTPMFLAPDIFHNIFLPTPPPTCRLHQSWTLSAALSLSSTHIRQCPEETLTHGRWKTGIERAALFPEPQPVIHVCMCDPGAKTLKVTGSEWLRGWCF